MQLPGHLLVRWNEVKSGLSYLPSFINFRFRSKFIRRLFFSYLSIHINCKFLWFWVSEVWISCHCFIYNTKFSKKIINYKFYDFNIYFYYRSETTLISKFLIKIKINILEHLQAHSQVTSRTLKILNPDTENLYLWQIKE